MAGLQSGATIICYWRIVDEAAPYRTVVPLRNRGGGARQAMLTAMLRRSVARNPAKTALVQADRRVDYRELENSAARLAGAMKECGVTRGDTVAVWLPNGPEFVIALFAVARVGAIMLPIYPASTAEELRRLLRDRPARLFLTDLTRAPVSREIAPDVPVLIPQEAIDSGMPWTCQGEYDGPALFLYTSGSTGLFKRLCCTQRNLFFEARNFVGATGMSAEDAILCSIPLHHSYGLGNCLLDAAYLGATLVFEPSVDAPFAARHETMLELLPKEQVRVYPGVPFQYEVLASSDADVATSFRGVRWCLSSGDVLPQRTFDRFLRRSGHPIRSLYGSTEAGSIAMDCGAAKDVHFGSLGTPLENVTIELRGEAGEIWVKSPTIPPSGYENRPELNASVFRDGFYNTGDFGRLDPRGHLVLSGRKQSFVDVGGYKVDLSEVEEVLNSHPMVREAAAVRIEVSHLGGAIKAVAAARDGCRERDILEHCRRHLAAFKVPRLVEFREMLPRSPIGKLLRSELTDVADWLADVPSARELPSSPRLDQIDWMAQRVREQVAAIARRAIADVPLNAPFQSLGFDSLYAVELQERLSRMSGVALSITTLWNYTSILAYAAFLIDAIEGRKGQPTGTVPDEIDSMSDEQVAAFLAKELATASRPEEE
jgi:long-chain acyl-CoA synthetase